MDKKEYFEISNKKGLPDRCPILDQCERRLLTIYRSSYHQTSVFNNYLDCLKDAGEVDDSSLKNLINLCGETPGIYDGGDSYSFSGFCPEVNLFDSSHCIGNACKSACSAGNWDKYRKSEKFIPTEHRHYSECPEFNKFLFNSKNSENLNPAKTTKSKLQNNHQGLLKVQMKELVAAAEIKKAIDLLLKSQVLESSEENTLISLSAQLAAVENESNKGTLTFAQIQVAKNQITSNFLNLVDQL